MKKGWVSIHEVAELSLQNNMNTVQYNGAILEKIWMFLGLFI